MFKKMIVPVFVVLFAFVTSACTIIAHDGQELTVKRDTTCYQCPKGNNLSRFDKVYNCESQVNWGTIAKSDIVTATGRNGSTPNQSGYIRVEATIFSVNPFTNEKIDLGQRICWVNGHDLKK